MVMRSTILLDRRRRKRPWRNTRIPHQIS